MVFSCEYLSFAGDSTMAVQKGQRLWEADLTKLTPSRLIKRLIDKTPSFSTSRNGGIFISPVVASLTIELLDFMKVFQQITLAPQRKMTIVRRRWIGTANECFLKSSYLDSFFSSFSPGHLMPSGRTCRKIRSISLCSSYEQSLQWNKIGEGNGLQINCNHERFVLF